MNSYQKNTITMQSGDDLGLHSDLSTKRYNVLIVNNSSRALTQQWKLSSSDCFNGYKW